MTTLAKIYKENYKLLFRIIYSRTQDIDDTQDILHDTFVKALIRFDSDKCDNDHIIKWLIATAKNTTITYMKKKRTYEPLEDYIDKIASEEIPLFSIFLSNLRELGTAVPKELFDCLSMNIIDGVSLKEISRRSNISYERLRYWRKILLNELAFWVKNED